MQRSSLALATALLALGLLAAPAARAEDGGDAILGRWITENDVSNVEITRCGERYCGRIISLKEPNYPANDPEAGKPKRDRENPDDGQKSKPIIGLELLKGFSFAGDGEWEGGTIYDPENGKTYKCEIKLAEGGKKLNVRGYVGISLIGRTTIWKRVEPAK